MEGGVFPGPGAEKSGVNVVRAMYDLVVGLWRRHDVNLDFRLDFEEFATGCRLDPAMSCAMMDGCYEYV